MSESRHLFDSRPESEGRRASHALRILAVLGWSVIVWVALWGEPTLANVTWGAVLGAMTVWLVPVVRRPHRLPVRPWHLARLAGLFLWALVRASGVVAWEIVTPNVGINEGIVAIPLRTTSPGLMTLIANFVSLTPGTLTLEARREPATLYVHVLHLRGIEEVRGEIHRVEEAVLAAFAERPTGPEAER